MSGDLDPSCRLDLDSAPTESVAGLAGSGGMMMPGLVIRALVVSWWSRYCRSSHSRLRVTISPDSYSFLTFSVYLMLSPSLLTLSVNLKLKTVCKCCSKFVLRFELHLKSYKISLHNVIMHSCRNAISLCSASLLKK